MKAFSFLSILKNFGKQLSSLASQMPWCNLRFNLGSISVLSRVNPLFSRTSFGTSRRASHFAAMIFAVLTLSIANIGMAWGEDVPWEITEADVTTLTATQGASITIGSGSKQYSVHAVRGGGSNKNSDSWVDEVGMKFGDGNLYKSGIAVYVPTTSNNISSISFYMKKSADKARVVKYYAADAIALESEPSTSTQTLTTSFAPYSPFSSPAKGKYYIVGGYTGGSGDVYLQKVVVTFADATPSCTAPTNVAISGEYIHFPGENLTLNVSGDNIAQDATYTWKKGGQVIAGQTTATLTINSCEITDAGNYTCTVSNGNSCEATADHTIKMYRLRGLTDNNWTTDFVFEKADGKTATYSMVLAANSSYEFKVHDGSVYYGNTGGNPTMTSDNCTNWTMQENMGNNVTLQTTAAGTYTFTLDYTDASNPTISVTYPAKRIVYLNPDVWASDNPKFAVHAWHGSTAEDILMTKIDDCNNRNIYFAEIDAAHTHVIFIRGNKDSYDISNPWNNVWNQTGDLTIDNVQYNIGSEWNFSKASWTSFTPNYTVTFDENGHGTAPDAQCVAKNGKATTPTTPTATGYTFGGWYKEAGCINAWNFANDVVTENTTLYAKWTANNYTITYDGNHPTNAWNDGFAVKNIPAEQTLTGGTGTVSNNTPTITEDESSEYAIYTFNNWNTAADGKGTSYAAGAAITITENTTLYAQWTPRTYNITYYDTDKTTVLDLEPKNYTYGTGVASLPTPTKDGYTFSSWTKWWDGGEESNVSSISNTTWGDANLAAQWTENTPAPGTLTALECGTLYKVENMVPSGVTLSGTGQYAAGISENTKFEVIGDPAQTDDAAGTPEMKNEAAEFASQSFTARMYLKGASNTTGSGTTFVPTSRAVKFIVGESGTLDIYAHRVDRLYLKKVGDSGTTQLGTSTSGSGSMVSHNVTAGTYYIYATNSNTCIYGIQLNCCTTPDAPTEFTAGSITSTGATFTITDAGDAASYDIYYSTSSTAPAAGTAATTTSTSKTKEVTGLTASTTYYAWVRSVCDDTHKSSWVALGTTSFTTAAATYSITYNCDGAESGCPANVAAATNLPSPLPTGLTKDGYTFGGWYTDEDLTVDAVAGAALTGNTTLYAKWTVNSSSECITITDFATSNENNTCGDGNSKIFYGYKGSVRDANALTITSNDGNDHGQNSGAEMRLTYNKLMRIYANNTTNAAPATFSNVTSVSFKWKFIASGNSGNTELTSSYTVKVGSTTIANAVSITGKTQDGYQTVTIDNLAQLSGYVEIKFSGSSSSYNVYLDDIEICTASMSSCTTPAAPTSPTNGETTSNSQAVSWTDTSNDAWEVYLSTSSSTPGEGQSPTAEPTTASYTFTGLTASTTYYWWVRSVCDDTHKSSWFAGSSFTTTAATTYSITYNCDGAESGCPSNVAATTNLPNPLPTGLTKDGYDFGGWFTDSECTVAAVAGAALTGNTDLYAKWTERGSECEDTPHAWDVIATSAKSYKVRISKVTEEVAIPIADATASNLTAYAGTSSTSDNVTVQIADGGSSKYGYKFDGSNTYLKLVFSTPLVLNDTLVVGMTNAAHNISFTTTAVRATTLSTSGGKLIIPAALAGQSTIYLWRGSGTTMYLRSFAVKHECEAIPSCTTPVLEDLSAQTKCPGEDVTWTANNTEALQDGEMIAYQWNKKGNNTVLSSNATLTLNDVTEATGGTYVVTAIVSADGKASKTASKEVTLTVIPATATPTITANASTIYTGNNVTLTATCASSGVGYQWYTCTDADGNGALEIDNAENAEYTFTAGEAGTYYYKVIVTGDGTHSCGTAEEVYTLIVSTSNSGETTCGEITGQFANGAYTFDTDFIIYGVNSGGNLEAGASSSSGNNRCGGSGSYFGKQRFVVTFPVDVLSFSFIGYQSNLRTVEAVKTTTDLKTANTEYTNITHTAEASQEGDCQTHVITPETAIPANTFVWVELNNGLNLSEICYVPVSNVNCTDPQVIATVDNATVCEGTENVTFTATNYADGAEFQWQKKNGNTWKNIDATSATYTIISPVTTEHAGQYRVIATKEECSRTSEELTLTVLTAPEFNAFANTASVMKGNALTINDVEATNATDYTWYKSADNSFDVAADTKVGTTKELLLAASSITEEANQIFYLFCVASNSCGSAESNAITVTVTPFVEEECATKGNEGEHEFGFTNTSCSQGTYSETAVWTTNSRSKYLTYTAPEGKYFKTAKVTVAVTSGSKCGYAYSTDGGTTWTYAELTSLSSTLTEKTINLSALGGGVIDAFRISRNLQDGGGTDHGVTSGNFHLSKACFEYADACTATTLTVGSYNNEYNISTHADFVEPTFTLKAGETPLENQTLTYTSSNPAIATVDEDGSVIFEGMTGKVTITVAFAGATINETEYCACQATYTITVGCTDRAPEIVAAAGTDLNGCNNSITLEAKMQGGTTAFADGTYQWYRDGEAIEGATSASYEVVRAGTYTVSRTYTCTTMSSNSAVVKNENPEPKVERLTPFQYYHVDKDYSDQMKDRHLFAVTSYGTLDDGKRYHLTATRNGDAINLSSTAFFTIPSSDNAVDTVMIDLNKLKGKYSANDEIVITCAPINNCNQVSAITSSITIHVIGQTPTLALICSGAKEDGTGTRVTKELMVGGDFLTGYNPADLCQQTGSNSFDPNIEWGFYTELKKEYIVTPVNGYAPFNKLNYEPFDILLLTDYPKSSRGEDAATILDDMAELCDYRPLLSFKTHMVAKSPSKWAKKGFTTSPVVPAQSALYADIVCYAHPMFSNINNTSYTYHNDADHDQLIYKILDRAGYEKKNDIAKGIQGFELADASNFVTIGLIHNDASAAEVEHTGTDFNGDGIVDEKDTHKHVQWTNGENDRKLVAIAERQANVEARMILFSINCGAQSLQTEGGRQVILQCLKYLYNAENLIEPAECHLTFDNKHGDNKWSNHLNWAPRYTVCPTENDEVRIAAPCTVDITDASVLSVQILEGGSLTINQGAALVVAGPITRFDKETDISSATESEDILIGSDDKGNGTLIFSNANGTTKATVKMYSTAKADMVNMSAAKSTWQYIGTPHSDVQNAADNYYESWLYQYDTGKEGWVVIPNGGPLVPFKGYCVTHPENPHTYTMTGTLAATTNQDITIPAEKFVVVANSWTAPIQVANFEDDDLENLTDKTVYLFNTGSDPEGDGTITPDASATQETRYAAGTYISIPIHSALYTGDATISSMQGFYVVGGDAEGTLHLNYDKLVRPKEEQNIIGGPMHAPARITDTDNEPQVAKFLFRGKRYDDRLIILERPDFTRGYDSGWDGEQWGGNAAAPMSYVVAETRYDAVSAIPEYEGTVIGFRAGEDNIYTIHFDYDGMEEALYLLDTETKIYTRVLKGNSYTFACPDKAEHNRFILTRKAPQIATGTENIATGENAKAVKFIKDDKIFIFVNGILYDATGKMVVR